MAVIIGVDIGGTFTDFFTLDSTTGKSLVFKTSSTPANPVQAVISGLKALIESEITNNSSITRISHGTTVATNALLQRKGAKLALIVTEGFKDLLEIGRQTRPHLYSLQLDNPAPLVPRNRRFEARERVGADGEVMTPLDEQSMTQIVASVQATGVDACAVCLLFSFLNPRHERDLKARLEAAGCRSVSISSDVQPEFREFERMSTTVLNAYLQPLMSGYLESLDNAISEVAPNAALRINQSSGGLMSAQQAARFPVRTALSGPAAGAVGAVHVASTATRSNVITLDMGGTSADICLIRDGAFSISYEGSVGGFPIRLPMADVNAVGAGGGSIAWFDRDGLMKVGPISAGAKPGPACYGLGGDQPTVTDASLILGRLPPSGLLDGQLPLDIGKARAAFAPMAESLDTSIVEAAFGCFDIVVANMVRAIRTISVERGHDPADFALLAFGGGGPLHAHAVAASLGITEVIVPPHPGILCAQGLLAADITENFVATNRLVVAPASHESLCESLRMLVKRAEEWFDDEGAAADVRQIDASLDMRYVGQNYEFSVPLPSLREFLEQKATTAVATLLSAFRSAHQEQYGTNNEFGAIEIINVRISAKWKIFTLPAKPSAQEEPAAIPDPDGHRDVFFSPEQATTCPIFSRRSLLPGMAVNGPAVVEQLDTTTVVYPNDVLRVDSSNNLIIKVVS